MYIGFRVGIGIGAIRVWGRILRYLGGGGDGEDWVHMLVCF